MSLTITEVEHIANLARLELSAEEIARYREQLSAILEYAIRLQSVDTSQIEAAASANIAALPLREDIVRSGLDIQAILRNAPQSEDSQFRVPPVLE
jgi:aspartyl-tRNA(Asn)/glutamyl-tRNA(Gln) amidotransferase subunit C